MPLPLDHVPLTVLSTSKKPASSAGSLMSPIYYTLFLFTQVLPPLVEVNVFYRQVSMRVLGWTVSLLSFSSICWAQSQCYFPNGRQAADNSPCDPDAKESACCGGSRGTVCLTNKLCRGPDGNIIRGSCTDKNWDSPECAQYCLSTTASCLISVLDQRPA